MSFLLTALFLLLPILAICVGIIIFFIKMLQKGSAMYTERSNLPQPNHENTDYFLRFIKSPVLKAIGLFILLLLMCFPLNLVENVIHDRSAYRTEAQNSIANSWGGAQYFMPGMLIVPYRTWDNVTNDKGKVTRKVTWHRLMILPEKIDLKGTDNIELRRRGIFEMPLYTQTMQVNGEFNTEALKDIPDQDIAWHESNFVLGISDLRGLQAGLQLVFNENKLSFSPGSGDLSAIVNAENIQNKQFIHTKIAVKKGINNFAFNVVFRGSQSLSIAPVGKNNSIELVSQWAHPNFNGDWLPNHKITPEGFTAKWLIPDLSRPYAQSSLLSSEYLGSIQAHQLSINFNIPVDGYKMSLRAAKYGILFILLTFALYFLMELLGRAKIHIFQYILVGLGLSLFYLLQLALTEHLSFMVAYWLASFAIILQVGLYSSSVLSSYKLGLTIGVVMGLLYAYLYTLLEAEDYALLSGALGLFVILSGVMIAARKIDWQNLNNKNK